MISYKEGQPPDFGSSFAGEEPPLPRYGLGRSFVGKRWIEGEGWDICTVVHRSETTHGDLTVGVIRRTTALPITGRPRIAIAEDLARESVATALIADLPNIGDQVFDIAAEVARDGDAWRMRDIKADGDPVVGYEREYRGMWVAYYLTDTLIVYVLAPAVLRLDALELKRLQPNEVGRTH